MIHFPLTLADPASLTTMALGAVGSLASGLFGSHAKAPAAPQMPAPSQSPIGSPESNKPAAGPSFLAAAAAPLAGQTQQKTLTGQ